VAAPDLARAAPSIARFPRLALLELRLADDAGLEAALRDGACGEGVLAGRKVVRVEAASADQAKRLLSIEADFEVCVDLTKETAAWVEGLERVPARVALRQPSYERLSEAAKNDVAPLKPFLARLEPTVPVEGVPACILGRAPRTTPPTLDTTMRNVSGRLEIFRYTRRYIHDRYRTKALGCKGCSETARCDGLHINFVRAHGYAVMEPLPHPGGEVSQLPRVTGTISSQP
jgi:hypothetical protein